MKNFTLWCILLSCWSMTFGQGSKDVENILPPFYPTKIKYEDIPKTKIVGGRVFNYSEPRYEYHDDSDQWYIFERPKGIFTYYHNETRLPYKIDFYQDTILVRTLDLKKINPYTISKYPSLQNTFPGGEIEINDAGEPDPPISEFATSAGTFARVGESDQNYISVDFEFMGTRGGDIYLEHTIILYDNTGRERARIEHIKNPISIPLFTHKGRYMSYCVTREEHKHQLIIRDIVSDTLIFDSYIKYKAFDFWEPNILSKDPNSISPYTDGDSCYIMSAISNENFVDNCDRVLVYIDIENRKFYLCCNSNSEWAILSNYKRHYLNITENLNKGTRF